MWFFWKSFLFKCSSHLQNPCGPGLCLNVDGGYECQCPGGYEHTEGGCHDEDECQTHSCGDHGDCTNLPGTFHCRVRLEQIILTWLIVSIFQCHPGFEPSLNGSVCVDIDEVHLIFI